MNDKNKGTAQAVTVEHDTFTLAGDLIMVDFFPGHFEPDPDIIHTFFPGRVATLSDDGRFWTGITCSPSEWEDFVGFAEYAVKQDPDLVGTAATLRLLTLWKESYEIFQRNVTKGPFKSPREWGAAVA